ncbi:MAG: hypothetical protein AAB420_02255 [Patescibacteria group bacterium]
MSKIISIITTVTLISLGFWITAEPWVNSETKFSDPSLWIAPAAVLIVFAAVISLGYMLLPQKRLKLLLAGLIGSTYLVIFGVHYLNIIAFFVIILFHVFAIRAIHLESEERLKIHPIHIIRRGITEVMLPLYFALSFAYFLSPSIQERVKDPVLSPSLKQAVSRVMDEFLEAEKNIPQAQKQIAKNYALEQTYDTITRWSDPYRVYFPPVLAFGLFLMLWGLGFALHWLSTWIGALLFVLLRKTKFVVIEKRNIEAEHIALWQQTTTKL